MEHSTNRPDIPVVPLREAAQILGVSVEAAKSSLRHHGVRSGYPLDAVQWLATNRPGRGARTDLKETTVETAAARAGRIAAENYAQHMIPATRKAANAPKEPTRDWPGGWVVRVVQNGHGTTMVPHNGFADRTRKAAERTAVAVGGVAEWVAVGWTTGAPVMLDRAFWDSPQSGGVDPGRGWAVTVNGVESTHLGAAAAAAAIRDAASGDELDDFLGYDLTYACVRDDRNRLVWGPVWVGGVEMSAHTTH